MRLNIGCSDRHLAGYINVDCVPPADLITDLEETWPLRDNSVDVIVAHDIIEHLHNQVHTMNEMWRVLRSCGYADIIVPTTDGRGAFQDPTHVSYWNRNSFFYFTHGDPHRERFGRSYGIQARFKVIEERHENVGDHVTKLRIILEAVK